MSRIVWINIKIETIVLDWCWWMYYDEY